MEEWSGLWDCDGCWFACLWLCGHNAGSRKSGAISITSNIFLFGCLTALSGFLRLVKLRNDSLAFLLRKVNMNERTSTCFSKSIIDALDILIVKRLY